MSNIYDLIKTPSVNVILGKRGSGKSALAHSLLENLSIKYSLNAGIVGFPEDKKYLLPNTYQLFRSFDFPRDCVIFIDEISFFAHSRRSMSNTNMIIDQLMSRARHMNWIFIMATHHASKLDISIIRDADNIMFKEPSRLEVEYGSRKGFVYNIANKAKELFNGIDTNRKPYFFFINEDCECMLSNSLASYWSEELSITTVQPITQEGTENHIEPIVEPRTVEQEEVICYYCNKKAIGLCEHCDQFVCEDHQHSQNILLLSRQVKVRASRKIERDEWVKAIRKELRR